MKTHSDSVEVIWGLRSCIATKLTGEAVLSQRIVIVQIGLLFLNNRALSKPQKMIS